MDKTNALQIIKTVLDQAIKAGVLQNVEAAATVAQAFTIIAQELNKDESTNA
jgi:hypothetical protein